jgi:hypothetical protein
MTGDYDEMSATSRGYAATHRRFDAALDDLLSAAHKRGLADGLAVARKIRDWLTRQPDREWQRQVREWADVEIAKAEKGNA